MQQKYPSIDVDNPPPEIAGRMPTTRVTPLAPDVNPFGDIFGGWILSQMDLAGAAHAFKYLGQRVVTVGVEAMTFHKPVAIGDVVSFYTDIKKIGNTSIAVQIESWAFRRKTAVYVKVTEGLFTFVMVDPEGKPVAIDESKKKGF